MSDYIKLRGEDQLDRPAHINPWLNCFGGERWIEPSTTFGTDDRPNSAASPTDAVMARLNSITLSANAVPCKKCNSKFRWRDCYSTKSMHCEKCNKPPSLAMVKAIFGLIALNDGAGFSWLEMTEVILPLWREQQHIEQRAKRSKKNETEEDYEAIPD